MAGCKDGAASGGMDLTGLTKEQAAWAERLAVHLAIYGVQRRKDAGKGSFPPKIGGFPSFPERTVGEGLKGG